MLAVRLRWSDQVLKSRVVAQIHGYRPRIGIALEEVFKADGSGRLDMASGMQDQQPRSTSTFDYVIIGTGAA